MPDKYKLVDDPVLSYRNYYMSEEKQRIATWKKKREKPAWYLVRRTEVTKTIKITRKIKLIIVQ